MRIKEEYTIKLGLMQIVKQKLNLKNNLTAKGLLAMKAFKINSAKKAEPA